MSEKRARRTHPLSMLLRAVPRLSRLILPLGFLLLSNSRAGGRLMWSVIAVLALLTVIWSVVEWWRTTFIIDDDALHLQSGVLQHQSRVIPRARIQSVNLTQSALLRLLRLAELEVETATQGAGAELSLSVVRLSEARKLRELLVGKRATAEAPKDGTPPVEGDRELIAAVSTEELMIAGGTSNNVAVLLALLVSGCQRVSSQFSERFDAIAMLEGTTARFMQALGGAWFLVFLVLGVLLPLLFLSWAVSVAGAVLRYRGFTLERAGRDLRRSYGWLSRVEASIPLGRAQALLFEQSLLRRPFYRGELRIVTAGSAGPSGGANASSGVQSLLPIVHASRVAHLIAVVFPDAIVGPLLDRDASASPWIRAAPYAWLPTAIAATGVLSVVALVLSLWSGLAARLAVALVPLLWLRAWQRWRRSGIAVVAGHVVVRRSGFASTTSIIPERKLQLIELTQGPIQQRLRIASLRCTAAGAGSSAVIDDLPIEVARELLESLSARVGSHARRVDRSWRAPLISSTTPFAFSQPLE